MTDIMLAGVLLLVMFAFLGSGVLIGAGLLGVGLIMIELFTMRPVGASMATTIWSNTSGWSLAALPLFVWMGEVLLRTRLASNVFLGLAPMVRRVPGGLLHANIGGCTAFSAVSGSSAATLLTVGRITLPELRKRNYPDSLSCGTLAGAGTLGLMIPPSITLIIYGLVVEESIARLFMAGVLPGLMLAGLFFLYIFLWGLLSKEGRAMREPAAPWGEWLRGLGQLLPIAGLIVAVIGSIYTGIASPNEAAVVGLLGAFALSALQRTLTLETFVESLSGAVRTTSMIFLLLAGAAVLTLAMGFSGLPRSLADWVGGMDLSPTMLLLVLMVFFIVLGCFLDGMAMILLTIAVLEPMVRAAGIDMIWFGIFVVLVGEMALITPPVGFNLFLVQSLSGRSIGFVARAAAPMFGLMLIGAFLLIAFPQIALWLPNLLTGR
ncbi:TRAP transporter large permease [Pararhodobacter sp.]|jgi:C4-dicarboxylate transporter DctM subunit|uniref:TRAP transporter large permease n=1 Tax=Pararhodobacter sp. TaxID=2127056 RepID=UPI002FDD4F5E